MCRDSTVVSVLPTYGADGEISPGVRYDAPGSMHPMQMADLAFVPVACAGDTVGYIRRHARRVLLVRDDPLPEDVAAVVPAWITRMRRHHRVDGTWVRIHDDGTLEMRDPNDGQCADPRGKIRHQYRIDARGAVLARSLPPETVGDAWADIGVPEWEPRTTPPRDDLIYAWWEAQVQ